MDEVAAPALPMFLSSLSCVFLLTRESTDDSVIEFTLTAGVIGQERQKFPVSVDFQGKNLTRSMVTLAGVVIMQPGIFRAEIALRDSTDSALGYWDIAVNVQGSAPAAVQILPPTSIQVAG